MALVFVSNNRPEEFKKDQEHLFFGLNWCFAALI